jgi:GNAT superfamily N-acetyltransferase
MLISSTISYLEMKNPAELREKQAPRDGLDVVPITLPQPELNRFFYCTVGGDWYWINRLDWTYSQWSNYVNRPELQTWIVTVDRVPAGYFELELQPGDDLEIVYFGLLPAYVEQGIGGWALSEAVKRAWATGAKRVWMHTCTLDHPRALANYLARGFRKFKEETSVEDLPEKSPGPWPGARKTGD